MLFYWRHQVAVSWLGELLFTESGAKTQINERVEYNNTFYSTRKYIFKDAYMEAI